MPMPSLALAQVPIAPRSLSPIVLPVFSFPFASPFSSSLTALFSHQHHNHNHNHIYIHTQSKSNKSQPATYHNNAGQDSKDNVLNKTTHPATRTATRLSRGWGRGIMDDRSDITGTYDTLADRFEDMATTSRRGGRGGPKTGRGRGGSGGSRGGGAARDRREVDLSKALSRLLRHQAGNAGIELDREGYAPLDKVVC
jgi:uncharacterized membrane protein YgcG